MSKSVVIKMLTITLSASIIGSWGLFYWLTGNISNVNLSLEGLNTCFSRVSQNYSGKMIGPNQPYTQSSFYHMTEECFSDLEKVMKNSFFLYRNDNLINTFKELVKKTYWFHRDDVVENEFTSPKDGKIADINRNYQEIEKVFENVTNSISMVRTQLDSRKKYVFYLGLFSVVAMAFISLFSGERIQKEVVNVSEVSIQNTYENSIAENILVTNNPIKRPSRFVEQNTSTLSPGPEKFDEFFNRFLRLIAPRLIRKGINFDFTIDAAIPRVLHPEKVQKDLEIFFERAINFNLSGGRISRVDCYQIGQKKTEIRFYDNGVCLLKNQKHFKNVQSNVGIVLGVELRQLINPPTNGIIKTIIRGKKKDLMRELQS